MAARLAERAGTFIPTREQHFLLRAALLTDRDAVLDALARWSAAAPSKYRPGLGASPASALSDSRTLRHRSPVDGQVQGNVPACVAVQRATVRGRPRRDPGPRSLGNTGESAERCGSRGVGRRRTRTAPDARLRHAGPAWRVSIGRSRFAARRLAYPPAVRDLEPLFTFQHAVSFRRGIARSTCTGSRRGGCSTRRGSASSGSRRPGQIPWRGYARAGDRRSRAAGVRPCDAGGPGGSAHSLGRRRGASSASRTVF